MSEINSERWQRASPHLDKVLDLSPEERDACLRSLWEDDPLVAADVEALLAEHRLLTAEGSLTPRPRSIAPNPRRRGSPSGHTRSFHQSGMAAWAAYGWRSEVMAASRARRR